MTTGNEALDAAMANASRRRPEPGVGDLVAAVTTAVGIPPCGQCKRNQQALNAATPSWARRILGRLGVGGSRPGRSPGSAPP